MWERSFTGERRFPARRSAARRTERNLPHARYAAHYRSAFKRKRTAYAAKIRPVLFGSNGEAVLDPKPQDKELYWIESTPIATVSAAFYRKVIGRADGLKELGRIESYHPFHGYYIFLRPSTADAIYQCPKDILDKVCAFAFVTPDLDVRTTCDFNLEMHKLTIVYFEGEVPQEIAATPIEW